MPSSGTFNVTLAGSSGVVSGALTNPGTTGGAAAALTAYTNERLGLGIAAGTFGLGAALGGLVTAHAATTYALDGCATVLANAP